MSKKCVMMTIKEIANATNLPEHYVRSLCLSNSIQYKKTGKKYLINYNYFLTWLNGGTYSAHIDSDSIEFMSIRQLASLGIVSEYMIRKAVNSGDIPSITTPKGKHLVSLSAFYTWLGVSSMSNVSDDVQTSNNDLKEPTIETKQFEFEELENEISKLKDERSKLKKEIYTLDLNKQVFFDNEVELRKLRIQKSECVKILNELVDIGNRSAKLLEQFNKGV